MRVARALLAVSGVLAAALAGCGDDEDLPAPGTVLDREEVAVAADRETYRAVRVRYVSVGAAGDRVPVTGVVFLPPGLPPREGRPVLAYGHGTVGGADPCAPSRDENLPALAIKVAPFVAAGYVVAATDYEGLGTPGPHPYLHGPSAGRAMADVVRAARAVVPSAGDRWAALGHSQGGHAALFAAEVGADHADELDLVGAVALAPAADLDGLIGNGFLGPSFEALAVAGWFAADPDLDEDVLTDSGRRAVATVERDCFLGDVEPPLVRDEDADDFAEYLAENEPGADPGDTPLLVVQGRGDQLVTPAMTQEVVDRLCAGGATVQHVVLDDGDHESVYGHGVPLALEWLAARFAGAPAPSTC